MSIIIKSNISLTTAALEREQIAAQLEEAHTTPEIIVCKQLTGSTNDDALALYQQGYRSALVVAQQQKSGRGQHQRHWQSPPGNIYLSVLLQLHRPVDGRFALECGLNILHTTCLKDVHHLQIKWSNDLYSPLGKWGGILVEPINSTDVIVGIGINVLTIPNKHDIPQPVTSLSELAVDIAQRSHFIGELYLAILNAQNWFNYNSQNLATRFNHVAAFMHQAVLVQRQHQPDLLGHFLGIQDDGALLIASDTTNKILLCYDGRLVIPE